MKLYVRNYRLKNRNPGEPNARRIANVEVDYHIEPKWKIESLKIAEAELRILKQMSVRVGLHFCKFDLEALPDGKYAIFCLSHPEIRRD